MGNLSPTLACEVERMMQQQADVWPLLKINTAQLREMATTRCVELPRGSYVLQHNPARAISAGAKVDPAAIGARPCFLCEANRPSVQQWVEFGNYHILANPYPIFPEHLTVASKNHQPQRIGGHVEDLLALAAAMPGMTVFYNGPECGASAPDHLHFQMARSAYFSIWRTVANSEPVAVRGRVCLYESALPFFVIEGRAEEVAAEFGRLVAALPCRYGSPEPKMNLLAEADGEQSLRMIVVPRSKHRPACYGTGPGQRMVSPGTIDVAGLMVLPRCEDFETMGAIDVQSILDEVSVDCEVLKDIIESL